MRGGTRWRPRAPTLLPLPARNLAGILRMLLYVQEGVPCLCDRPSSDTSRPAVVPCPEQQGPEAAAPGDLLVPVVTSSPVPGTDPGPSQAFGVCVVVSPALSTRPVSQSSAATFPGSHSRQRWHLGRGLPGTKAVTPCSHGTRPGRALIPPQGLFLLPQKGQLQACPASGSTGAWCVAREEGPVQAPSRPLLRPRAPPSPACGKRSWGSNCPQMWGSGKHGGLRVRRPGPGLAPLPPPPPRGQPQAPTALSCCVRIWKAAGMVGRPHQAQASEDRAQSAAPVPQLLCDPGPVLCRSGRWALPCEPPDGSARR